MSVRRRCGVWSGVVCVHACYISAVSWRVRARSGRSHTLWWRGRDWPWRTDSSELLVASSGREWQSQSEETGAGTAHKVDGHTTHPGFTKTITQGSQMRCSNSRSNPLLRRKSSKGAAKARATAAPFTSTRLDLKWAAAPVTVYCPLKERHRSHVPFRSTAILGFAQFKVGEWQLREHAFKRAALLELVPIVAVGVGGELPRRGAHSRAPWSHSP